MKKHLSTIIIISLFILGLSIMLYPTISNFVNQKHASRIIGVYNDELEKASEEKIAKVFEVAEAYNKNIADTPSVFFDPSLVDGYNETLDITGTGVMGYIDIDKINVELPIYHGTDDVILQIGVGHLEGTSMPVSGDSVHCVLSGHRGLPSARLFTDLDDLVEGDTFTITILNRLYTYEVDQIKVIEPSETDDLQIVEGKEYCTLLTCTPYGINTHRLLVRGVRVGSDYDRPGIFIPNEAFKIDVLIVLPIVLVPMLLILLIILIVRYIRTPAVNSAGKAPEQEEKK